MTQAKLVENEKRHIDIQLTPIKGGDSVTEESILALIENSIYTNHFINESNIKSAVAELNDVLQPLQEDQTGRVITYQVLEKVDAKVEVSIESDEMSASATITTAQGGAHLSPKAIVIAAQSFGVKKGFCKESLVKLAELASKAEPNTEVSHQIAQGLEPIKGKDAIITPLVESAQNRILKPKKQEDGSVNMRDLGDIICVKVGDPLAKKTPLTLGKNGFSVTAKTLKADAGKDIKLESGEGTAISPNNPNVLISKRIGVPKLVNNGMEVDEVYKIKNVDVASGNITFTGSVIIDGDVNEGMTVIASGDITIGGFVESATIKAGGDITIAGGIIGKKYDPEQASRDDIILSVKISAKGNISAKYCQYGEITAFKDILIEKQLMHSFIDTQGKLIVGLPDNHNGTLLGGYLRVGELVSAGVVGATAGNNTSFNFERKILAIKERIKLIEDKIDLENENSNKVKNEINTLKKSEDPKSCQSEITELTKQFQHHSNSLGKLLLAKEKAEEVMQDYMSSVYIEATEKLYQGVELIIGDFHEKSKREYGPSKMRYHERKILIDALT
ncbi:MAG: DUF342 domain-containing protein [Colwellia sp.]